MRPQWVTFTEYDQREGGPVFLDQRTGTLCSRLTCVRAVDPRKASAAVIPYSDTARHRDLTRAP
jgi:hypothetical protein